MKIKAFLSAFVAVGLVAWLSGFIANALVNPVDLKQDAVKIEVAAPAPAAVADEARAEPAVAEEAAAPEATPVAEESGFPAALPLVAAADAAKGEKIAKACAACHTFDKGGKNKVGPNLWGVVGRKKDSHEGFKYSGKLVDKGGDVWTYAQISHFIYKPKAYAPGTKMTYAGLKDAQKRADVLAYLRTLADTPAALPTDKDIKEEAEQK